METVYTFIQQNNTAAVIGSIIGIFLAGYMFDKLKLFSILLLICAIFVFYTILGSNDIEKINIEDIKKKVKEKVIEKLESK